MVSLLHLLLLGLVALTLGECARFAGAVRKPLVIEKYWADCYRRVTAYYCYHDDLRLRSVWGRETVPICTFRLDQLCKNLGDELECLWELDEIAEQVSQEIHCEIDHRKTMVWELVKYEHLPEGIECSGEPTLAGADMLPDDSYATKLHFPNWYDACAGLDRR